MITITWTNTQQKAAGMSLLADRVGTHHVLDWTKDVADVGWKTIDDIAREDTSVMRSTVTKMVTAHGGSGTATAGYGVAGPEAPFYTEYQEDGTKHGIKAMLSIPQGAKAMEVEASDAGMRMLGRIRTEWNSI